MMPDDPIVNDHFADCLWMIDKKFKPDTTGSMFDLKDTEDELREKVKNKLLFGLENLTISNVKKFKSFAKINFS